MRAVFSKTGTALKIVFLTAGLIALPGITSANEAAIEVVMNQAKIVKLAREADTIVIGNPEIADAAVQDATTIVLTGKGFGVTNLVVLDIDGQPIVDEQVMVSRQSASSVRIYRRANVQTLSCTPYCESSYKTDAERASEAEISANQ
ncbi:pilus assembly protein N-terminal domain-containing protein [Nitratireductor sp. B36]|uniref:pilus assembly protein N-terminal domain-containing protein n=1 Tax=Nitratireductor sp. B36 TaxID=2762059 RepID=UPI002102768C|nr:pilus assembly protein N-terminal domain-containing protein [Nitratireductor sp. B36]MCC5780685.1 pilus assembly protein N-terminal domain-containing protein [Nitratireductor sp. B36]